MGLLRSLPKDATMLDLFKAHAEPMARLIDFEDKLMRGPSPFSDAEREIISAFTSGLNSCTYCHRSHSFVAEELGVGEAVVPALLDDIDSAPIDARLRPILRYVRKLTLTPSRALSRRTPRPSMTPAGTAKPCFTPSPLPPISISAIASRRAPASTFPTPPCAKLPSNWRRRVTKIVTAGLSPERRRPVPSHNALFGPKASETA